MTGTPPPRLAAHRTARRSAYGTSERDRGARRLTLRKPASQYSGLRNGGVPVLADGDLPPLERVEQPDHLVCHRAIAAEGAEVGVEDHPHVPDVRDAVAEGASHISDDSICFSRFHQTSLTDSRPALTTDRLGNSALVVMTPEWRSRARADATYECGHPQLTQTRRTRCSEGSTTPGARRTDFAQSVLQNHVPPIVRIGAHILAREFRVSVDGRGQLRSTALEPLHRDLHRLAEEALTELIDLSCLGLGEVTPLGAASPAPPLLHRFMVARSPKSQRSARAPIAPSGWRHVASSIAESGQPVRAA